MLDVALPWCGAFRITRRPGSRRGRIARSAFFADVAGQDDRHVAQADLEHDRVFVADALAFPVGERRVEDAHLDVAEALASPACTVRQRDAVTRGRASPKARSPACGGTGHALPDRAGRRVLEHAAGAEDVVGIAVGQDQGVQPPHAERPQRAHDHALADVEAGRRVDGVRAGGERRDAAGIDQQRPAARAATTTVASPCPTSSTTTRSGTAAGGTASRATAAGPISSSAAQTT